MTFFRHQRQSHTTVALLFLAAASTLLACQQETAAPPTSSEDIVEGTFERRFPAVGYLSFEYGRSGTMFSPFCTATLIAPRVVATANHCVHDTKYEVKDAGPWMSFATGDATSAGRSAVLVSAIYEAPGWDPTSPRYFEDQLYKNDLALLVLESPVTGVIPAEIEAADPELEHLAVGYGRTKTGPYDLIEEGPTQRKALAMKLVGGSPPTFYDADPVGGAVCYGDSGGPLLQLRSSNGQTTATFVGVLASMDALDPSLTCVPGTRAHYASLVAHRSFVDQVLAAVEAAGGAPVPGAIDAPKP